jgi:hypothetical protein
MPINSFLYPGAKTTPAYEVANSLRFDDGSSDNLSLSVSSTSQSTTGTISFWFKRSTISADQRIFVNYVDANNYGGIKLQSDDKIEIVVVDGGSVTGKLVTTRVFRDVSAWYHCVVSIDSSNSTAGNRMRLYINGSEETSFDTDTNPSSSATMEFFTDGTNRIGQFNSSQYFDGYLAEFVMIHGSQLNATSFGEFDEDSPNIWKPKSVLGLTSGSKDYHLDFENASSLGADVSGNSNNFTVNNLTSVDQSTDTCTNNFATLINASSASKTYTLSEGNLKVTASASNWYGVPRGSIGVSSGKWYYEIKVTDENNNFMAGYMSATNLADVGDRQANGFEKLNGFQSSGYVKRQDNTEVNISSSFQWNDGDIAQIALDMDNKKLWIGKNGSYYNSGDPASGSNETIGSSYFTAGEAYLPAFDSYGTNDASFNFGSPPYSISSGNSDPNGYGNFEYSVPSGYYALNTKNLAEFG